MVNLITEQEALARAGITAAGERAFAPEPDRFGRVEPGEKLSAAEPTVGEVFSAAFQRENILGGGGASSTLVHGYGQYEFDESFDPLAEDNIAGYEQYSDIISRTASREHSDAVKASLLIEKNNEQVLNESGALGVFAQITAGVLDPTVLIPVFGTASKARQAFRASTALGKTVRVGGTAATVAGGVAVQEAILQAQQELRSNQESYYAIAGSAIFAGALGAVGAKVVSRSVARETREAIESKITKELQQENPDYIELLAKHDYDISAATKELQDSVGAARVGSDVDVSKLSREGREQVAKGESIKGALGAEKLVKNFTPLHRMLNSRFLSARIATQKLITNPLIINKNAQFKETEQSVEALRDLYQADFLLTNQKATGIYREYRKEAAQAGEALPLTRNNLVEDARAKLGKKPNDTSFLEEVGRAMRTNDEHPNIHVAGAAKEYRKMFDKIGNEAVRSGIWKELPDRVTAESYFSRMYDHHAIDRNPEEFESIIRDYIAEETAKQVGSINSRYDKRIENINTEISDLEINEFRKASFLQDKAANAGDESDLTLDDVKASLEFLADGKPKKPKTMLRAIADAGGISAEDMGRYFTNFDDANAWSKKNRAALINRTGGRGFDDVALELWEKGYFPNKSERPEINDLVNLIDEETRGLRDIVHPDDYEAYEFWNYFNDVDAVVSQLGLNPKELKGGKTILTDGDAARFRGLFVEASEQKSKVKIGQLREHIGRLDARRSAELEDIQSMGVDGYAGMVAEEVISNIRGLDRVSPEFKISMAERGPLKGMTLHIPDERIERFTINDASVVAERYARTVGTDVEIMNKFGSLKLEDIIAPIKREFDEEQALLAGNSDALAALKKEYDGAVRDIEGMYQLLRGTYPGTLHNKDSMWNSLGRSTLAFNYVRMLGGVAVSSIPDIGKLVGHNGFLDFYRHGLAPVLKNIPKILSGIRPDELEELKFAAITIQHLSNSRAQTLADLGSRYGSFNNMDRAIDATTKVFSRGTGIVDWNNFMESMGGIMSQRRILKNILNDSKLSKKETEYMASIGIGEGNIDALRAQVKKHSKTKDDGFVLANTQQWDDLDAIKAFRAALNKDVRSMVIEKNIGDVPLAANTAWGQVLLQFKSFVFASMNKTLISSLQRRDSAALQGITSMIAVGAATYVIKQHIADREVDLSAANLLSEGIDRSGVLTVFGEINNIMDKGGFGVRSLVGGDAPSRYYSRSGADSLLGPSLGTVYNLFQAAGSLSPASDKELSDADRRTLRKLIPFNNLFYITWLMRTADKDTRKAFGF